MENPIKILHIATMNRGGQETFIMNIFRKINTLRVQFDFLMYSMEKSDYDSEILELGGMIHKIPFKEKKYVYNYNLIRNFIKSHPEYKIIHIHTNHSRSIFSLLTFKFSGVKVLITHSHNTSATNSFLHLVLRPIIRKISSLKFACSKGAGEWLFGKKIVNDNDFYIIKNSIDTAAFLYNESVRIKMRNELGINHLKVVGHIGRFATQKNHNFLIEIFNKIHSKEPSTILILIGTGELENSIKTKVSSLGLKDHVLFLGVRNDVSDILQAMDVLLFPSLYEGLPVTLIEAQASGLSIVASNSITKEVQITDLIVFQDLDKSSEEWAEMTIAKMNSTERIDRTNQIIDAGYDSNSVSKSLTDLYLNKYKESYN